jgi:hypothetical protein
VCLMPLSNDARADSILVGVETVECSMLHGFVRCSQFPRHNHGPLSITLEQMAIELSSQEGQVDRGTAPEAMSSCGGEKAGRGSQPEVRGDARSRMDNYYLLRNAHPPRSGLCMHILHYWLVPSTSICVRRGSRRF